MLASFTVAFVASRLMGLAAPETEVRTAAAAPKAQSGSSEAGNELEGAQRPVFGAQPSDAPTAAVIASASDSRPRGATEEPQAAAATTAHATETEAIGAEAVEADELSNAQPRAGLGPSSATRTATGGTEPRNSERSVAEGRSRGPALQEDIEPEVFELESSEPAQSVPEQSAREQSVREQEAHAPDKPSLRAARQPAGALRPGYRP